MKTMKQNIKFVSMYLCLPLLILMSMSASVYAVIDSVDFTMPYADDILVPLGMLLIVFSGVIVGFKFWSGDIKGAIRIAGMTFLAAFLLIAFGYFMLSNSANNIIGETDNSVTPADPCATTVGNPLPTFLDKKDKTNGAAEKQASVLGNALKGSLIVGLGASIIAAVGMFYSGNLSGGIFSLMASLVFLAMALVDDDNDGDCDTNGFSYDSPTIAVEIDERL